MQAQLRSVQAGPSGRCPVSSSSVCNMAPSLASRRAVRVARRQVQVFAEEKKGGVLTPEPPKEASLEERIASGQYTDSGSTKEKLTRPIRQALAKDPVGLGE